MDCPPPPPIVYSCDPYTGARPVLVLSWIETSAPAPGFQQWNLYVATTSSPAVGFTEFHLTLEIEGGQLASAVVVPPEFTTDEGAAVFDSSWFTCGGAERLTLWWSTAPGLELFVPEPNQCLAEITVAVDDGATAELRYVAEICYQNEIGDGQCLEGAQCNYVLVGRRPWPGRVGLFPPLEICATDVDSNGETNIDDVLAVLGAWGPCPP